MKNITKAAQRSCEVRAEYRADLAPKIEALAETGMTDIQISEELKEKGLSASKQLIGRIRGDHNIKKGVDYLAEMKIQKFVDAWNKHKCLSGMIEETGHVMKTVKAKLRDYHHQGLIDVPPLLLKTRRNQFTYNAASQEKGVAKANFKKGTPNIGRDYFIERLKEKTPAAEWHFVEAEMQKRRA